MTTTVDIVDTLTGASHAAPRRPSVREHMQATYEALFEPVDDVSFARSERWLIAAFATLLTADDDTAAHYASHAQQHDPRAATVLAEARHHRTTGPFGHFPESGLHALNTDGDRYQASPQTTLKIGTKLAAGLEFAHLLTYRPRETTADAHDRLIDAGWSIEGIVTLAQLVAFLSFQQRVITGLRLIDRETRND